MPIFATFSVLTGTSDTVRRPRHGSSECAPRQHAQARRHFERRLNLGGASRAPEAAPEHERRHRRGGGYCRELVERHHRGGQEGSVPLQRPGV